MKKYLILAFALTPSLAFAQGELGNISRLLDSVGNLVDAALPIVVGLALLGFFWGLAQFVFAGGDESAQEKGKSHMIWGVVALFVMVSVWGLVGFIGTAFNVDQGGTGQVPQVENL